MAESTAPSSGPTSGKDDFESVQKDSETKVASFERGHHGFIDRLQHFLDGNPTMVPVIVLVLSVIAFGLIAGGKFSAPSISR